MQRLSKSRIIEALRDWNLWTGDLDTGTERIQTGRVERFLTSGKVISVFGVRRAGKSYVLRQVAKRAADRAGSRSMTLIVNFEEPMLDSCTLDGLQTIWDAYKEIIRPKARPFIFLDEIQNVPRWERFVRSLQEKHQAYVAVSGSSARLLSEELSTLLAGRQLGFEVFPLGFGELLRFKDIDITGPKDLALNMDRVRQVFRDYLSFGGFPEIVLNPDEEFRMRTIRGYHDDIIIKDAAVRFGVRKVDFLKTVARYYLANIAAPMTFNSISRFTGEPVETVRRHTEHLTSTRCIFFVKRFSYSFKEQENSPRKVYAIDPYLATAAGLRFGDNRGKVLENLVAVELLRRQALDPDMEVCYFKAPNGKEVDFVVKRGLEVSELIQVCWDVSDAITIEREQKGLAKAMEAFGLRSGLVLTEDFEEELRVGSRKLLFKPAWRWMLEGPVARESSTK